MSVTEMLRNFQSFFQNGDLVLIADKKKILKPIFRKPAFL